MKTLALLFSILILALASCQIDPGTASRIETGIGTIANKLDRNQDSVVTNREIQDSKNDPTFWIAVGSALLGLLGVGKAASASSAASKAQTETDEQWDLHLKQLQQAAEAKQQ